MVSKADKNKARLKRHKRVRSKISGTAECPRLNVFRSNTNIYAQLIDDVNGVTLAAASSLELDGKGSNKEAAFKVGEAIAKKASDKGIDTVVFDRFGSVPGPDWSDELTERSAALIIENLKRHMEV